MIFGNPKAPLLFGTVMIGLLAVYLTRYHPSPAPLAAPHAQTVGGTDLATCQVCHTEKGLTSGCLSCHTEIGGQLDTGTGYHAFLLRGRKPACAECHPDHLGPQFRLVSQLSWGYQDPHRFDHSHVRFTLDGAHKDLDCHDCHRRSAPFALPKFPKQPRSNSYLGLTQECADCHEDVHEGTVSRSCEVCHGQEAFRPATQFRHDDYYVLEGVHARAACSHCHLVTKSADRFESPVTDINDMLVVFAKARGKACADCHETPHHTRWSGDCTACHLASDAIWATGVRGIDSQSHALTGFPLDEAHASVACEKCHPAGATYERRYPDPNATGYARRPQMCQDCHDDPHAGQFRDQYPNCADCHSGARFKPSSFDVARHARVYPLSAPHATVACIKCHPVDTKTQVQRFVSVSHQCDACHADPHEGQFQARYAQCTDCHEQDRFLPTRYDVAQHATVYPLTVAHAAVPCIRCHVVPPDASARRFVSTPKECRQCHFDPHAGQFAQDIAESDCTACHLKDAGTFTIRPYDHARQAGYPLTGAHAKAQCGDCHRPQRVGEDMGPFQWTRIYRNTSVACDACHADAHRGQFKKDGAQDCQRCHGSTENWTSDRFDHNRDARFKLEGVHADVECSACHPSVRQPDGQDVVQYQPLGIQCEDCHGFTPK